MLALCVVYLIAGFVVMSICIKHFKPSYDGGAMLFVMLLWPAVVVTIAFAVCMSFLGDKVFKRWYKYLTKEG